MSRETQRIVLDVTYESASQDPPADWSWELGAKHVGRLGIDSEAVEARLVAVLDGDGDLAAALGIALRADLSSARESLSRMTTRAVTAESDRRELIREVARLRGYITDARDSWDDPGMAIALLDQAVPR